MEDIMMLQLLFELPVRGCYFIYPNEGTVLFETMGQVLG